MLISFLKIACSVNFLVDRGGDSFVRSDVRVFTLFFVLCCHECIYLSFFPLPVMEKWKSGVEMPQKLAFYRTCWARGHQQLVFYRTCGAPGRQKLVFLRICLVPGFDFDAIAIKSRYLNVFLRWKTLCIYINVRTYTNSDLQNTRLLHGKTLFVYENASNRKLTYVI